MIRLRPPGHRSPHRDIRVELLAGNAFVTFDDPSANADGRQDRLNQAWLRQTLRRFHREEGQGYSGGTPGRVHGRQFNSKKVTNERVVRYAYWCVAQGVLKVVVKARAAKAGAR